jgi:uncharacterized membrane protein
VLAALGSAGLLGVGVSLHERGRRTDAARAASAAGLAGLFTTVTVAARVYELVPALLGIVLALGVGALATALAVRWTSRGLGALGILGAVAAPLLSGAPSDGATMAILFVALVAAAGVVLWQRWDWLALSAFALATPQWVWFLFDGASPVQVVAALVAFGALGVALAVGHDLRVRAAALRFQPAVLLALNALVLAVAGWFALDRLGDPAAGKAWLVGLAATHAAVGLAGPRLARVSQDLRLLALALGVVLADVAFALLTHGLVLAVGWTAAGVAFAALLRRVKPAGRDAAFVQGGLGGHLALVLVQAIAVADPLRALDGGEPLSSVGIAAVVALAAGCLTSARLVGEPQLAWSSALDALGLATVALLTALMLDGSRLALAWIGEALALTRIARRFEDRVAAWGALGFLSLAAGHALAFELPPSALADGLADPLAAVQSAGGAAIAALWIRRELPALPEHVRRALAGGAALGLLGLASGLVVGLGATQEQGQMLLSVFWALVGLATLVAGLRHDVRVLRLAALALLGTTAGKVFLVDLATLTSVTRVASFVGFGLLLLVGAFAWQRSRPRAQS